jgi:hypothetical protein
MTFRQFLEEKRRNPDMNPFIGAWDYFFKYKDDPDVYISFTTVDKIGINPLSKYNTPIGIYTYPLKEFAENYVPIKDISANEVYEFPLGQVAPFAGGGTYINFIRSKNTNFVKDMYKDYGSNDYDRDMKTLRNKYSKVIDIETIIDLAKEEGRDKNPIGFMWNITRLLAINLAEKTSSSSSVSTISGSSKSAVKWTKILSEDLGYSGFADKSGKGYIHTSEPMQAVFFNIKVFTLLHRVENKPKKKEGETFPDIDGIGDLFKLLRKNFIIDKLKKDQEVKFETVYSKYLALHFNKKRLLFVSDIEVLYDIIKNLEYDDIVETYKEYIKGFSKKEYDDIKKKLATFVKRNR